MPASTTRGYPYPVGGDPADGPSAIQAMAAAVDSDVSACVPDMALTSHGDIGTFITAAYGDTTLTAANYASVSVIRPKVTVTPTKFAWWCFTQNGNFDLAIINATTRARLWSLGSTACPAPGAIVTNIVAGPTLTAGVRYGLVIASNSATFAFRSAPVSFTGMTTLYDGTLAYGEVSASFPIPVTLNAWAYTADTFAAHLRA